MATAGDDSPRLCSPPASTTTSPAWPTSMAMATSISSSSLTRAIRPGSTCGSIRAMGKRRASPHLIDNQTQTRQDFQTAVETAWRHPLPSSDELTRDVIAWTGCPRWRMLVEFNRIDVATKELVWEDRQAYMRHLASDGNCIVYYSHPQHPSSTFVAGKAVAIVLSEADPAPADAFSPFDFTGDAFGAGGRLGTRLGS